MARTASAPQSAFGREWPLGRAAERAQLVAALEMAGAGGGQILVIEGEGGIGSSTLIHAALEDARSRQWRTIHGAAREDAAHQPFAALGSAFPVSDWTGGRPVPAGSAAENEVADAAIDLVEKQCGGSPVLIAMEDLHWADASTLLALNRLAREVKRLAVLLVLTARPLPRMAELEALLEGVAGRGATWMALAGLNPEAMADLAESRLGTRPGESLLAHLARAGGNPSLATELLASLEAEGAISVQAGRAVTEPAGSGEAVGAGEPALPAALRSRVLSRLSFLPEDARETLQVASILGRRFSLADLAVAVGKKAPTLKPLMAACLRAGILENLGTQLAFRHPLVRQALYQDMPAALRGWLHLAAAHVLAESGRLPEELAEHVILGAAPGDLGAVEWLRTAARQASSRSPTVAARLLRQAIELAPPSDPHAGAARADLVGYLIASGQMIEAEDACRRLLSAPGETTDLGQTRLRLAEALFSQNLFEQAEQELARALASPGLTAGQRCRCWAWSSACRIGRNDLAGSEAAAHQALDASGAAEDELGAAIALGTLAAVAHLRGAFEEALVLGRQAIQRAGDSRTAALMPYQPDFGLAACLQDLDRMEEARATIDAHRALRRDAATNWDEAHDNLMAGFGHFWLGEWDQAGEALQRALDAAQSSGNRRGRYGAHSLRALIALHRGHLGLAERESAAAESHASFIPQWRQDWSLWGQALLAEASGQEDKALALLTGTWNVGREMGVISQFRVIVPDLVRLALRAGEWSRAEAATGDLESLSAGMGVASMTGAALHCRAQVEGDPELFRQAVEAYRPSPRRRQRALACEDAAAALASVGARTEAEALAGEALDLYRFLDAQRDIVRAQERFASGGLTSQAPTGATVAAQGEPAARVAPLTEVFAWHLLTPAELAVVDLVAEGPPNREIARRLGVSARTVQTHVSHALVKLGISSRVELAVHASARGQR